MEEKNNSADNPNCRPKSIAALIPFFAGLILALAFGWLVFPELLFSQEAQPFFFSHQTHLKKAGAVCADCHSLRSDGSFTGIPNNSTCASCHEGILSPEPGQKDSVAAKAAYQAEKTFVEGYLKPGKSVDWKVHQRQPDNVFFSHPAHFQKCFTCHLTMKGRLNFGTPENPRKLCVTCHPSIDELEKGKPVERNVLTGYSRTTLKMSGCEHCHAYPGHFFGDGKGRTFANNACFTCHK
ncbi:MAG: cytochrome c family protein [Desulfovibrio sp.]|jgi:hypothetical protein|nr:cytochrome c family protein [Desulfovibrio sp.]